MRIEITQAPNLSNGFIKASNADGTIITDNSEYLTTSNAASTYAVIGANVSSFSNDAGYIITETDPIFTASNAFNITANDILVLANTSGTNTGDQDLSGYLTTSNASATYETISNVYTHTSNATIHFTESSIDHINIQNIGNNTHAQIDTDLTRLANTSGTNTGDQDLSDYLTTSNASATYVVFGANVSSFSNDAGYIVEAPIDGSQYARQDGDWTIVSASNADTVDGFHASQTPTANTILPLNSNAAMEVASSYIENSTQDEDILIKINDGGVTRTAMQIHGDSANISMPLREAFRGYNTGNQTIPNVTVTVLLWNAEDYDTQNGHSTSTNTGRYYIQESGVFTITSGIRWLDWTTTSRYNHYIQKNGGTGNLAYRERYTPGASGGLHSDEITTTVYLVAGDYVETAIYVNVGGARTIGATSNLTWFSVEKIT